MKSRITELLGIKYPIFQGGMAWVADGDLAGAVSNAGGLGIIGGGNAPKEVVKANIDKVKSITDKPFGVNIMLLSPFADDIVDLVIEEGVKVVTTGAGNPGKYMERLHEAGITVIPVIPSVALAKRMEKLGADAVVAEGMEAGGHIGKLTTMTLVRQVADAVSIPVIGAGGVADGHGMAAVLMLGADAVQVGTRFVVAKESNAHQNFKDKILKAKDIDTVISASVVRLRINWLQSTIRLKKISWLVRKLKRKLKSLVQVHFVMPLLMEMWNMVQLWLDKLQVLFVKKKLVQKSWKICTQVLLR